MKKKTGSLAKRLLSLMLAFVMVFGFTITTDLFHVKDTKEASAAQLTVNGTAAVNTSNIMMLKTDGNALTPNGVYDYRFCNNNWYLIQTNRTPGGRRAITFVDTDTWINGASLSSTWDNINATAKNHDSIFPDGMKAYMIPEVAGQYLFNLDKDALNNTVGGQIYQNAGNQNVWTSTVYNDSFAWYMNSASGGVNCYDRSYAFRVAPAFNLDFEKVLLARSASSLQNFGAQSDSFILPIVCDWYAASLSMDTIKGKTLIGYNGVYDIPYMNAWAGGYITASLYRSDGSCAYDGKLLNVTNDNQYSGTAKLDLSQVAAGQYTLMLQETVDYSAGGTGTVSVYSSTPIFATLNVLASKTGEKIIRTEADGEMPQAALHDFFADGRKSEYLFIDNSKNALAAETDVLTDEPLVIGQTYSIPVSGLNTTEAGKGKTKYISAIIYDDTDAPIYYGKLDYVLEDNDTTVKLTIPTTLDKAVTYKLALFEETASTADDDTCSTPVITAFQVTYKSVVTSGNDEVGDEWLSDTQNGIVWYYKLDDQLNAVDVWTKDAPDAVIDDTGCLNVPGTLGKLKYPVASIGGGSADTTFVPKSYNGYNSIAFPASCVKINKFAFAECQATANLTIPSHMQTIEAKAFYKMPYLRNVTIKGANLTIGKQAFAKCSGLQSFIDTGNQVTIGEQAFYKCNTMTKVSLFEDVTIQSYAFAECKKLSSLKMDLMRGTIAAHAFENCDSLTSVFIPNTITSAEPYAFNDCDMLANVEFDMDVLSAQIFANCDRITKLILDKNVTSVDSNWGGYNETPSAGSIAQGGNTVASNADNSERSIYVFNRNTEFCFDKDAGGNFYSAFGVKRSNSLDNANHNYYRATKVYYITLQELPDDFNDIDKDGADTTPRQEKTITDATSTANGDGSIHLRTGIEDIARISVSGCDGLKASSDTYTEDSVQYLLTAHQACQLVGEPNDAAANRISYSAFISNDYSQATKQNGIAASYPASVDNKSTINKSSFTVYPTYNDGTPYKATYEAAEFTVVDAVQYEAMKTAEATKDLFMADGSLKVTSKDEFLTVVGDDSTISPNELSEDASTGTQSVVVIVFTEVDGEDAVFTTTVNITVTKKASDFDALVNEYGSVAAVMIKISDLQADITAYKSSIITATNDLWHSVGVTDKDSVASMTNSKIIENFNAAVAAAKKAGADVSSVEAELAKAKADLSEMTAQYSEVVKQLNAMVKSDDDSVAETKPEDFVRVTDEGTKQIYVDGKWYDIKGDGDPTAPDGAIIEKEVESVIKNEDGTVETVTEIVEVTVKVDKDKISISYEDPVTKETVTDSYSTELQNMVRIMTAQLTAIQKQLSEMNVLLTELEAALGITADTDASAKERVDAIVKKIEQMKAEYDALVTTNAAISAEYDKVIDKIYGENKPDTTITADDISAKIDGVVADRVNKEVQDALADNDAATAATTALQSKLTATVKEILAAGNPDLGGSGLTDELIAALNEVKAMQVKVTSLQDTAAAQAEFLTTIRTALSLSDTADASAILASIQSLKDKIAELTAANETLTAENALLKAQVAGNDASVTPSEDKDANAGSTDYKTGYAAGQTAGYNAGYAKGLADGKATGSTTSTDSSASAAIQYLNTQLTGTSAQLKSAQAENTVLQSENKELTAQVSTLKAGIEELYDAIPVTKLNSVGADTTALTTKLSKIKNYLVTQDETNASLTKKNKTLQKKVTTLQSKNDALTEKNEKLESKNDALKAKNETLSKTNQSLTTANQSLQANAGTTSTKSVTTYTAPSATTSVASKTEDNTTAIRSDKTASKAEKTTKAKDSEKKETVKADVSVVTEHVADTADVSADIPTVNTPIADTTASDNDRIHATTALRSDSEDLNLLPVSGDPNADADETTDADTSTITEDASSGIPVQVIIVGILAVIALIALIMLSVKKKQSADVMDD